MKNGPLRNTLLAVAIVATLLPAGPAKAQQVTLSYTNTGTVSGLNIFTNLSLTKFDSNLGILDSVTVTVISAILDGNFTIGAADAIDQEYESAAGRITIREDPTNSLGYTQIGESTNSVTTTPAPVVVIPAFTTNTFAVAPLVAISNSAQSISSSFFSAYAQPGGGQLAFQIRNRPDISIVGGNFYLNAEAFTLETKMAVTYTYTVPEPSTWALLALAGMGGVAAILRRRS